MPSFLFQIPLSLLEMIIKYVIIFCGRVYSKLLIQNKFFQTTLGKTLILMEWEKNWHKILSEISDNKTNNDFSNSCAIWPLLGFYIKKEEKHIKVAKVINSFTKKLEFYRDIPEYCHGGMVLLESIINWKVQIPKDPSDSYLHKSVVETQTEFVKATFQRVKIIAYLLIALTEKKDVSKFTPDEIENIKQLIYISEKNIKKAKNISQIEEVSTFLNTILESIPSLLKKEIISKDSDLIKILHSLLDELGSVIEKLYDYEHSENVYKSIIKDRKINIFDLCFLLYNTDKEYGEKAISRILRAFMIFLERTRSDNKHISIAGRLEILGYTEEILYKFNKKLNDEWKKAFTKELAKCVRDNKYDALGEGKDIYVKISKYFAILRGKRYFRKNVRIIIFGIVVFHVKGTKINANLLDISETGCRFKTNDMDIDPAEIERVLNKKTDLEITISGIQKIIKGKKANIRKIHSNNANETEWGVYFTIKKRSSKNRSPKHKPPIDIREIEGSYAVT